MKLFLGRRGAISSVGALITGCHDNHSNHLFLPQEPSLDSVVSLICSSTAPSLRRAVQGSQKFLYRGVEDTTIHVENPAPDLLLPNTYDNPDALAYFENLQRRLEKGSCNPSDGHIATSDPSEAANWGSVASVWPIGPMFSYVWPKDRGVFFPTQSASEDNLMIDRGLQDALSQSREVLFATKGAVLECKNPSPFLCVPKELDRELLEQLNQKKFGFS